MSSATMSLAAFAMGPPTATFADYVTRPGKLFECGEYADKGFSFSEAEAAAAVSKFQPGRKMNLEHLPELGIHTILDNHLGKVEKLWQDGKDLYAEFAVPTWLNDLEQSGEIELKVSAELDRESKTIEGAAWVIVPRVKDAALMSDALPDFIPLLLAHRLLTFAGARHSAGDSTMIQAIHDHAINLGALCKPTGVGLPFSDNPAPTGQKDTRKMSFKETVQKWIGLGMPDNFDPIDADKPDKPAAVTMSAEDKAKMDALTAQVEEQKKALVLMREERIHAQAESFANQMIADKKILPAEKAALIITFTQAARDDDAHPIKVLFGEGKEGSRVDALKASYEARAPHSLLQELLKSGVEGAEELHALMSQQTTAQQGDPEPITASRLVKFHEMTPQGIAFLKTEEGKALMAQAKAEQTGKK